MKYKALFLDLDGTILQTLDDITEAVNYALKQCNLPTKTNKDVVTYLGNGSWYLIKCAINKLPDPVLHKKVFDIYKNYYDNHIAVYTKPYDGMPELLKEYKNKGGKLALVTNKPHNIAIELANKFYPGIFDTIYGNMDGINRKPNSESALLAKRDCGINKLEDILYIGDSLVDLYTAKNSGVKCLLVNYGYGRPGSIEDSGNDYVTSVEEIKGYIY